MAGRNADNGRSSSGTATELPQRPDRLESIEIPELPEVEGEDAETKSTTFSHYRSTLSRFRTGLSEHRTDLSEFRTDLSTHRTALSDNRTEMSMRRTGMSFQRTRMSADRTLMSEIRTALSLISFGFTIYQAFKKLVEAGMIHQTHTPRTFGLSLIVLGIVLLVGGIIRQLRFSMELRGTREQMSEAGLIHAESRFPVSLTLIVAIALTIVGLSAAVGILLDFMARS